MFQLQRFRFLSRVCFILGSSALSSSYAYDFGPISGSPISILAAPESSETSFTVKTQIYGIKPITLLSQAPAKKPWPLVSGRVCANCPEEEGLFLVNPETGTHTAFVYPGKVYDSKVGSHVLVSRLFYGRCLRGGITEGVVVFQNELLERKRWKRWHRYRSNAVFSAQLESDRLIEKLYEKGLPPQSHTLAQVRSKVCMELKGRDRSAMARPLDLIIKPEVLENESPEENEKEEDTSQAGSAGTETTSGN